MALYFVKLANILQKYTHHERGYKYKYLFYKTLIHLFAIMHQEIEQHAQSVTCTPVGYIPFFRSCERYAGNIEMHPWVFDKVL